MGKRGLMGGLGKHGHAGDALGKAWPGGGYGHWVARPDGALGKHVLMVHWVSMPDGARG